MRNNGAAGTRMTVMTLVVRFDHTHDIRHGVVSEQKISSERGAFVCPVLNSTSRVRWATRMPASGDSALPTTHEEIARAQIRARRPAGPQKKIPVGGLLHRPAIESGSVTVSAAVTFPATPR